MMTVNGIIYLMQCARATIITSMLNHTYKQSNLLRAFSMGAWFSATSSEPYTNYPTLSLRIESLLPVTIVGVVKHVLPRNRSTGALIKSQIRTMITLLGPMVWYELLLHHVTDRSELGALAPSYM